ncbi:MAG: FmdB family transcriptional regulator [Actinobacteria bacterium]|nr:FmdB family transcriptional regulator [Actinomycetota bacterium]
MPTYEYACTKCGQHLEVYQSFTEEPLKRHSGCGGNLDKVFGSVGIVLKGSGFYRTDHGAGARSKRAAKSDTGSESSPSTTATKDGGKGGSESKKADKPAAKKAEKPSAQKSA